MLLIECLNNEKIKYCTKIMSEDANCILNFSTPLEDVAMIEIENDKIVELTNGKETYIINYQDSLCDDWRIE